MRLTILLLSLATMFTGCVGPACRGGCDAGQVCVLCDAGADCSRGEVCAARCNLQPDGGSSCAQGLLCVDLPPAEPYRCCAGCPCAAPHDESVCR